MFGDTLVEAVGLFFDECLQLTGHGKEIDELKVTQAKHEVRIKQLEK